MSAPLARGIIIAASVVVAAGIALMENEQVRQWLDIHRRRIAIALYSLGDGINPSTSEVQTPEQEAEMAELTRQRRHEIVRKNREELIRKAREDGTAVDLDELTALGMLEREAQEEADRVQQQTQTVHQRSGSNTSFDHFVGNDGKLLRDLANQQEESNIATTATGVASSSDSGIKQRGAGVRGFASGSAFATNPFGDDMEMHDDDHAIVPDDQELYSAISVARPLTVRNVSPQPEEESPLPDNFSTVREIPVWEDAPTSDQPQQTYKTEDELNAEIEEAIRRSLEDKSQELVDVSSPGTLQPSATGSSTASTPHSLADSLFAPPSPRFGHASVEPYFAPEMTSSTIPHASPFGSFYSARGDPLITDAISDDGDHTPSGTLTPTDDAFSTVSSVAGDREPEVVTFDDVQSEADTNDSFSVVGASVGAITPNTWSDVDSESETEAGNGQSHIVRR